MREGYCKPMSYKVRLNPALESLKPSGIRRFFDIACEMEDVISLSIGEPDFSTPWHIREEGIKSLEKGKTWYSPNSGLMKLRESIADYTKKHKGLSYDPKSEILVTVGGSEAIDLGLRSLICPGDEVLIPEPSFVCYSPLAEMAGGIPVSIITRAEEAFRLTPQALREAITPNTRLLIMPFPNNPTGAIMKREHLEEIAEIIRETDIFVLSDEIYGELTYGQHPHVSFASIKGMQERTMLISGFSKAFAMTGWRLGYACGPKALMKQVVKLHQYALMCAPTTAQYAAIEALENGESDVESMRAEYDIRRRFIVDRLCEMGLPCFEPEGAFYVFPSVAVTGLSSEEFSQRLLTEKSVAVVPGTAFGDSGEGFIRISYCYSLKHITEVMNRMEEFVRENRRA